MGAIGIIVLYAMSLVHLLLFRGEARIGLMVVVQNIFTSLFNSHIFDFNEGWIYVLGVGIAGGIEAKPPGSDIGNAGFGHTMTAGMRARDELSAASQPTNPQVYL